MFNDLRFKAPYMGTHWDSVESFVRATRPAEKILFMIRDFLDDIELEKANPKESDAAKKTRIENLEKLIEFYKKDLLEQYPEKAKACEYLLENYKTPVFEVYREDVALKLCDKGYYWLYTLPNDKNPKYKKYCFFDTPALRREFYDIKNSIT